MADAGTAIQIARVVAKLRATRRHAEEQKNDRTSPQEFPS
jgi:hypothetical protein